MNPNSMNESEYLTSQIEPFPCCILQDLNGQSQLRVVPERGGIVTHWSLQDQEIFYFDQARFQDPSLSIRGGIPILFPICGNLPNNSYHVQGRDYSLKQHGFARDLPWQIVAQSPNPVSVTLRLDSSDRTLALYPFAFQLDFTYQLSANRLKITQRLTNQSSDILPYSLGLHPYFQVLDKTQLQFAIPASEYLDHRTGEHHSFPGTFDFSLEEIDVAFKGLSQNQAIVTDPSRRLRLTLTWSEAYSTLVFWTIKGKDYYCLEPWTAGRNALNTQENLLKLPPGETQELSVEMQVDFF